MDVITGVGFGALGLLVVCWLVVSFLPAGRRRVPIEWLAATAAFAALLALFANLLARAWAESFTLGVVAFGFLAVVFLTSFIVSAVRSVRAFLGHDPAGSSAVH